MKKEWFIQFENYHKGPFNQDEIMSLWYCKKITLKHLFWKQGMAHWQSFESIEDLRPLFPPKNLPKTKVLDAPNPKAPPARPQSSWMEKSCFFAFIGVVISAGAILWQMGQKVPNPEGLNSQTFQQLKKALEIPLEEQVVFHFSFDSQFNRLWISSNLDQRAEVRLNFQALSGKVLSLSPIEFQGKGKIRRHFANIEQFVFKKGSQIYPGFYKIDLSYHYGRQEKSFSNVIYLGPGSESEFAENLKTYKKHVGKAFKNYSFELTERYATLASLLEKTETLFKERFPKVRRGQEIKHFERSYATLIGPLLTRFTLDNFLQPQKVPIDLGHMKNQFNILSDLSKSLVSLPQNIIKTVGSQGKIPTGYRKKLQDLFLKKFQTLKNNIHFHKKRVQSLKLFQ